MGLLHQMTGTTEQAPSGLCRRAADAINVRQPLRRIAGGSETDVYTVDANSTEQALHLVKVKWADRYATLEEAMAAAEEERAIVRDFVRFLGVDRVIPNQYVISQDEDGRHRVLEVQPYLADAVALDSVDFDTLGAADRREILGQLRRLVKDSIRCYEETGHIPDLYGTYSTSTSERLHLNHPVQWPRRLWDFLVEHRITRSHNLMLVRRPKLQIVLVDTDPVRWKGWLGQVYYWIVRRLLFERDRFLLKQWLRWEEDALGNPSRMNADLATRIR
ncbi:MAG: hypothetical protein KDD84_17290 [Caldilineaceae bacterium]|nr:hypothetical protein [Caldilineaceae bacterium]